MRTASSFMRVPRQMVAAACSLEVILRCCFAVVRAPAGCGVPWQQRALWKSSWGFVLRWFEQRQDAGFRGRSVLSGSSSSVLSCGGSSTGRAGGSAPAACSLEVLLRCCLAMVQDSTQSVAFEVKLQVKANVLTRLLKTTSPDSSVEEYMTWNYRTWVQFNDHRGTIFNSPVGQ